MKILVSHRYYWPDSAPYASLLHSIVKRWAADGHEVDVITALPSYKKDNSDYSKQLEQKFCGITIYRLNLKNESGQFLRRLINAFQLATKLFLRAVIFKKYDIIMVSTYPPILGGFMAALASRLSRARFIYHCMDLHPEIGLISGEFSNPKFYAVLKKMDEFSCKVANPVVVLSNDMAKSLNERDDICKGNIEVINNFALSSEPYSGHLDLPFDWPEGGMVILFAGNVGRFQGLDVLMQAMAGLSNRPDISLVIMGDGSEKNKLEQQARESAANVRFIDHQTVEVAQKAMEKADIGFLSLLPNVYRYAYPSKTMSYLQQGLPILACIESESQLATELSEYSAGLTLSNSDPQVLRDTILALADDPKKIGEMRVNARVLYEDCFMQKAVLPLWSVILSK